MSTAILTQAVGPAAPATFGAGSMFAIQSATGPVTVVATTLGSSNKNRVFTNVPGGFKFTADRPEDGFDFLTVTSASNQNITIAVGDDDVTFSNAVTVTGAVATQEVPAGTIVDNANVAVPNAAQTQVAPVNASRRSITVSFVSNAAIAPATVYIRAHGGANNLMEVQAGLTYKFANTAAIDIRNDSGGALTALICEEQ